MSNSELRCEPQDLSVECRDLVSDAWNLYAHASLPLRLKQRLRPAGSGIETMFPYIPKGSSVLDIGCGSGLLLGLLAQRGRQISGTGFDPSAGAIKLAREMALHTEPTGSSLSFECRDGRDEEWPQGIFDVVTMVDVIHHVPVLAQRAVFDKACAAVRPGGAFVYKDMGAKPVT
jgi:2-polyprenyl-3-methyl-5-hydroxy-6-metoxy-1,4-benzoquinol methylase